MNYTIVNLSLSPSLLDDDKMRQLRNACIEADNQNQAAFNQIKNQASQIATAIAAIWGFSSAEHRYFMNHPIPQLKSNVKEFEKLQTRYLAYWEGEAMRERRDNNSALRRAKQRAVSSDIEAAVVKLLAAGFQLGVNFHLDNAIECAAQLIPQESQPEGSP